MRTMKARSVAAAGILLCMSLFVTATSAGRPVVEQQQKDSAAQVQPDWWGFPFLPPFHWPPFHWPGRGHFSPAPHSAPSNSNPKIPKWPFPHPPFPHFPIPKHPPATTNSLSAVVDTTNQDDSNNAHPDFTSSWYWYWLWQIFHGGRASPSPHGAPSIIGIGPRIPIPKTPHGPNSRLESTHFPANVDVEAAEKCWSPLAAVDNCVNDIMSAFTSGIVEFNSACCSAIKKMEDECVAGFNNKQFTDALNNYCSTH